MLHELLLALVGCTGDVFIDVNEKAEALGLLPGDRGKLGSEHAEEGADTCPFQLAPDLDFVPLSERELLSRLLRLGYYYRELDLYSTQSRNLSWLRSLHHPVSPGEKRSQRTSVYQRALANGVAETLAFYRSAVLKVEQNILSDPVPVLASVTLELHQFELLLPPLHAVVHEVEHSGLCGGLLLNLLQTRCHCGVPELQACMQRLLWHCHQVMYRQLTAWMVYGLLQDPHQEFFISRQNSEASPSSGDGQHTGDKAGAGQDGEEAQMTDWHTGFHVNQEMLPQYITSQAAEAILFVGKAVRVLRNSSASFKTRLQRGASKICLDTPDEPMSFTRTPYPQRGRFQDLLPQDESDKIASTLKDLESAPDFHKMSFERGVDSIRSIAAKHLWQLVVVHADLLGHLKALKDYFLLAKGDFFQCFLEESRALMRTPPRPSTAEIDLKTPFQQAATKTISDDDKYFCRCTLRMPLLAAGGIAGAPQGNPSRQRSNTDPVSVYGDTAGPPYDGWDGLALEYTTEWPLQLLFTKEVLAKYSRIFQYLLRLKRIQLELEKSWAEAMQQDKVDSVKKNRSSAETIAASQRRQHRMPMWRVRQHMTYLITNLQFYIQVDVIESQWTFLQDRVQASKDFTELARFHQEYLSALISQSFLDIGSVSRILDSIIKLCLQFCRIVEQQNGTSNPSEMESITEEFNKKSNSLYTILRSSKLAGSQRAPFLRQFLLRLNYNSFFEATARGALNLGRPRPSSAVGHL